MTARKRGQIGANANGRGGRQVIRLRPGAATGAAAIGLGLGVLALGPGLGPGYLLSYDMVFVPSPRFDATMFGLTGTLPRAVPSDAVATALAVALPADVVQKLILLAIFALACAGAARLLAGEHWLARLAAGVLYAWNPFVAERLLIGQWALLLGYASLPWVLVVLRRPDTGVARTAGRLLLAALPAAVGGFAAMSICGLVAIPAAALRRNGSRSADPRPDGAQPDGAQPDGAQPDGAPPAGPRPAALRSRVLRSRAVSVTTAIGVLGVLSLPWLIPALARHVDTSPLGVAAFAARADTPFGSVGSLLMLGGMWNAQTVPAGYGGTASALWLALALVALGGFAVLGRRRWPGLGVAAVAGLAVALLGTFGPGQQLLRDMITWWPGFAVLRDGQQFIAPLALLEALGFGLVAGRVLRARRPRALAEIRVVLAAALIIAPVLFLPGLAWGGAGRLRPVEYPAGWLAARRLINSDPVSGSALLLPWASYRRFGWNDGEAVLDPWPRLLARPVIWNDGVQVGSVALPPEDPAAAALSRPILAGEPLTSRLVAAHVRFVIVDAGARPAASVLAGCTVAYAGPGLLVYRVP